MDGRARGTRENLRLPAELGVGAPDREPGPARPGFGRLPHLHRFRWSGEDPFSPHNLYACRCGVVRPGL